MNGFLAWMDENQADGEIAMEHFLTTEEEVWTQWVPARTAERVKAALARL